jgi:hypothetical protein
MPLTPREQKLFVGVGTLILMFMGAPVALVMLIGNLLKALARAPSPTGRPSPKRRS